MDLKGIIPAIVTPLIQDQQVNEEELPEISLSASQVTRLLNNNPKSLSLGDIEAIYRQLL